MDGRVDSASESAFSDAEDAAASALHPDRLERLRQSSLSNSGQILRNATEEKAGKRKRVYSPKDKGTVSTDLITEIKAAINESNERSNAKLWGKIERKLSSFENRIEKLEADNFEKDQKIEKLEQQVQNSLESNEKLESQLEELERHSRSSNLVFSCGRFGKRRDGEDIAAMVVQTINQNFPDKQVTKSDFSAVHRLNKENTVICAFKNKNHRNAIYEDRVQLGRQRADLKDRLFVSENLSATQGAFFRDLRLLRKQQRIWTTFTKNGVACYKLHQDSPPTRVYSQRQLALAFQRAGPPRAPAAGGASQTAAGSAVAAATAAAAPADLHPSDPVPARDGPRHLGGDQSITDQQRPDPADRRPDPAGGRPDPADRRPDPPA